MPKHRLRPIGSFLLCLFFLASCDDSTSPSSHEPPRLTFGPMALHNATQPMANQTVVGVAASGNDVVALLQDDRSGPVRLFAAASTDGGLTFQKEVEMSSGQGRQTDGSIVRASNNWVVSYWTVGQQRLSPHVMTSADGQSWSEATGLDGCEIGWAASHLAAGSNDRVYFAHESCEGRAVEVAVSADGGRSFTSPVTAGPLLPESSFFAKIKVAAEGDYGVLVSWIDSQELNSSYSIDRIYAARSQDGGRSFAAATRIDHRGAVPSRSDLITELSLSHISGSSYLACWLIHPAITYFDSAWCASTADGGETFQGDRRISDNQFPKTDLTVANSGGSVLAAWTSWQNEYMKLSVFGAAHSTDGGASFSSVPMSSDLNQVEGTSVASSAGAFVLAYAKRVSCAQDRNYASRDVFSRRLTSSGAVSAPADLITYQKGEQEELRHETPLPVFLPGGEPAAFYLSLASGVHRTAQSDDGEWTDVPLHTPQVCDVPEQLTFATVSSDGRERFLATADSMATVYTTTAGWKTFNAVQIPKQDPTSAGVFYGKATELANGDIVSYLIEFFQDYDRAQSLVRISSDGSTVGQLASVNEFVHDAASFRDGTRDVVLLAMLANSGPYILRSEDGGATLPEKLPLGELFDWSVSLAADGSGGVIAAAADWETPLSMAVSQDGGKSFAKMDPIPQLDGYRLREAVIASRLGNYYLAGRRCANELCWQWNGIDLWFLPGLGKPWVRVADIALDEGRSVCYPPKVAIEDTGRVFLTWAEGSYERCEARGAVLEP
ncbi:MAG: exo-alpha-sialidase [Candidatus Schekmanbacteria bacterium]|nr:exo-alpha-sialidase [Candidatus Schekmanbacteria bacterium]